MVKNAPANAGDTRDMVSIPGSGRASGGGNPHSIGVEWQSTAIFLPGKSHGHRRMAAHSPWDHKELDTTK